MLSEREIAYLAGVIDARGYVEVLTRHTTPQPRITITTKRVQLLERLSAATGTKIWYDTRGFLRRPCGEHCGEDKHQHVQWKSNRWTVDSVRATIVLYNIQPFVFDQVDAVREALEAGLRAFPGRGDGHTRMAELGWALPEYAEKELVLPDHGTRSRYKIGCRCEPCRAAQSEYARDWRQRQTQP